MTKEMIIISVHRKKYKYYAEYMHNGLQYGTLLDKEEIESYQLATRFQGNALLCDFILHIQDKYKIYHLN